MDQEIVRQIIARVIQKLAAYSIETVHPRPVPIKVCNRHAHPPQGESGLPFGSGNIPEMQGGWPGPGQSRGTAAGRHIHMTPSEAEAYGVADGWTVRVKAGGDCGVIFENVAVLVSRGTPSEFHITAEEAAAAGVRDGEPSAYVILSKAPPAIAAGPIRQAGSGAESPAAAPEQERGAELEPEKVITEETVRQAWKQKAVLIVNKGVLCTPLARDAIKELGVQAIWR